MKTFRVYFFSENVNLVMPLNICLPVLEVIEQCLESYKMSKTVNQSLIKNPDRPEGMMIKENFAQHI